MPCNCNGGGEMDDEWNDDLSEMVSDWESSGYDPMDARRGRGKSKSAAVINLFGKRRFDFSFLLGSATQTVIVSRALHVVPFYYYWLMMRVHNIAIEGSAGNFTLRCFNTLPSKQDPREFSIGPSPALSVQAVQATTVGTLLANNTSNLGPFLKIDLLATQGATANQDLFAELSAVLYCRAVG